MIPFLAVSPPPSPGLAVKPFIVQPSSTFSSTPEQGDIVDRLLNSAELLYDEWDGLHRNLYFAHAEQCDMEGKLWVRSMNPDALSKLG